MRQFTFLFLRFMASFFKSKAILQAENLALRHQLCVLHRSVAQRFGLLTEFCGACWLESGVTGRTHLSS